MKNKRIELILEEVKDSDTVLNVGCASHDYAEGNIWLHRLLCEKARRVVGIDISPPPNTGAYNIIKADAESMELNEKFDLIVAGELIEHLSNPGSFFDRSREHLKEGGRLLLTTPNPWDWTRFVRAVLRIPSTPVKDHVCWYDKETITNLANRHGFNVKCVEYIPRIPYGGGTEGPVATAFEKGVCCISLLLCRIGFHKIASMNTFYKMLLERKTKAKSEEGLVK